MDAKCQIDSLGVSENLPPSEPKHLPRRVQGPNEESPATGRTSSPLGNIPGCLLHTPLGGWKEEWKLSFLKVKLSTRLRA
jgi:hypothetical protein